MRCAGCVGMGCLGVVGVSDLTNPSHYTRLLPEPIDVIEAWDLNFRLANALKYIARAGFKGDRESDLRKAVWYLQRELEKGGE